MKPHILLVEDDSSLRNTLKEQLEKLNCSVEAVENGQEALKMLESKKYTCVISDVRMPKVDGMSLLDRMKDMGLETPIVMMTGFSEYSEAEISKKGGAVLLEKPFNRTKLKELVEDYIMMLPEAS